MVGIVAHFQGYMTRPQPSLLDKKEGQVAEEAGTNEIDVHGDAGREEDDVVVEIYVEFKPVDHPLEPPDEDPPAKWPMPDSSLLNKEGKLSSTESAVRKAEDVVSSMLAKGFVLSKDALKRARSFDERHHFMSGTSAMALVPWRISLELLGNHHPLLPLQVKLQSCTRVKTF